MIRAAPTSSASAPLRKRTLDLVTDHQMIHREHLARWPRQRGRLPPCHRQIERRALLTSNVETLAERGILGNSWREPSPASLSDGLNLPERVQLRSLYPVA